MKRKEKKALRAACLVALFSAFICILSMIAIPIGQLPVTLQILGIYIALFTLGGGRGLLAVLLYVTLGAVGLPVFSGFSGGVGRLLDVGGGFILGFIPACLVFWGLAALFDRLIPPLAARISAALLSLVGLYLIGAGYYAFMFLDGITSLPYALLVTVLPYIPFDIIKIGAALVISHRLLKISSVENIL